MLGLVLRVCVLGLMVGWGCGQDLGVKVDSGMESINTVANYTFQIGLLAPFTYAVDAGSTVAITFPAQYSTTSLRNNAPYSGF